MILRQLLHHEPVNAVSYLAGCAGKGVVAVIDPVEEPRVYLDLAHELGVSIRYVIDTHLHADHVSTGRSLAALADAEYVLHSTATVSYPIHAVDSDDALELGNVALRVLHLPGHTPEHLGLLATDRTRGDVPWMIFSGHTLMVGDMGRTELASSAEAGARSLYESARLLKALPDEVLVLPGAFAGSVCGRGLSGVPISTIGFERRANRSLRIGDSAAFIDAMLRDVPPRPPGAERNRAINMGMVTPAQAATT